jgi:hypothetical protein
MREDGRSIEEDVQVSIKREDMMNKGITTLVVN